jgi:hypothetical protein
MRGRAIKIGAGVAVVAALAGGGVAWATAGDDEETVTGPAADRAGAAALAHVGGAARVTGVERESEDGATWEVEVARADGSTVDVLLDARYRVVTVEGDSESGPDDDADDDAGSDE